ncbi:MAG: hypothetical protein HY900_32735 [Deltaproteobacteria bacterium]|nr:hypothetical protein [Deltaproteobacteria bacterium]
MRKRFWPGCLLGGIGVLLAAGAVRAGEFTLAGKPASVMGYINQGATFGIAEGDFNNKTGFNSAVFQALVEGQWRPAPDFKLYASGKLTADWAYPILDDRSDWKDREFDDSRDELFLDTGWDKVLHEAHATWAPGNLFLRAGKQIVAWGESDGFRLMDQINPVDQRRGLSDVEFENTIIPLWLLRTDYYFQPQTKWLQDIGIETVFNPNVRFQANRPIDLGNNVSGIWAPHVVPAPGLQLGSSDKIDRSPDDWSTEGMEFGARVKAVINDMIFTVNYFNGISNDAQLTLAGAPGVTVAPGGQPILHLPLEYHYPRFRFVGATFTSDFPSLSASFLGGVAPVLRVEGFYGFKNTLGVQATPEAGGAPFTRLVRNDEFRYLVGLDWKVKVNLLNPKAYFFLSGQFFHRKILDFESEMTPGERAADIDLKDFLGNVKENNIATSLLINTSYFHNKLTPMVFWLRDITLSGNMYKMQLTYDYSDKWHYTVGALLLGGNDEQKGFEALKRKDQLYATVKYRF